MVACVFTAIIELPTNQYTYDFTDYPLGGWVGYSRQQLIAAHWNAPIEIGF